MVKIYVPSSHAYDVCIGSDFLGNCGEKIKSVCGGNSAVIVSDDHVFPLYGEVVEKSLIAAGYHTLHYVFAAGEASKNLNTFGDLAEYLCEKHLSRNDVIVALGGGVVGDLAGFAAATYRRGMKLVQIPTTLLSAVDSSVGGKTAVNLVSGKNQIGCFYNPDLVLCDVSTLSTLPEREYRCGCAEIIKYGMISDAKFFEFLVETPVLAHLPQVIEHCVTAKRNLVLNDERDTGIRMLLNFGHSFGHAVEKCSHFEIPHGLAVAAGMCAVTRAAVEFGDCDRSVLTALENLLIRYQLPTKIDFSVEIMLDAMLSDKKSDGAFLNLVIPRSVGVCEIKPVPFDELRHWLNAGGIK